MLIHNCNLNIPYTADASQWDRLAVLYTQMPGWIGYQDGCARWLWDAGSIEASIEPSGLQFYARMSQASWQEWLQEFKIRASSIVGYEVGEPEDGFALPDEI